MRSSLSSSFDPRLNILPADSDCGRGQWQLRKVCSGKPEPLRHCGKQAVWPDGGRAKKPSSLRAASESTTQRPGRPGRQRRPIVPESGRRHRGGRSASVLSRERDKAPPRCAGPRLEPAAVEMAQSSDSRGSLVSLSTTEISIGVADAPERWLQQFSAQCQRGKNVRA